MSATGLTKKELDVLRLKACGLPDQDIAIALFIWESTVRVHVRHILRKLHVYNCAAAVIIALRAQELDLADILIMRRDAL